jgi:hypothetical protein
VEGYALMLWAKSVMVATAGRPEGTKPPTTAGVPIGREEG